MTDAMEWDYREPNYSDLIQFPILKLLKDENYQPYIYELWISQEAPDAIAEIMVDYTAIFDGTSTAAVVYYDSTDAKDTAAGVGVRTIKIIGTDEAGTDVQEVTDDMAGQTGTATTEKWNRLWAFKAMTAGSEGDAAGTVTIQDDAAGTNKHMTIAAANVSSISARIYPPSGWKCQMHYVWASIAAQNVADGEVASGQGFIFRPIVSDTTAKSQIGGVDSDDGRDFWVNSNSCPHEFWNLTDWIDGDNDMHISLKHVTKADDDNQVALYRIVYILYNTAITSRGFLA